MDNTVKDKLAKVGKEKAKHKRGTRKHSHAGMRGLA